MQANCCPLSTLFLLKGRLIHRSAELMCKWREQSTAELAQPVPMEMDPGW